jgi:OmpA-OmpF porin, OOP family
MNPRRASIVAAGAGLCLVLSFAATNLHGPAFIAGLKH